MMTENLKESSIFKVRMKIQMNFGSKSNFINLQGILQSSDLCSTMEDFQTFSALCAVLNIIKCYPLLKNYYTNTTKNCFAVV